MGIAHQRTRWIIVAATTVAAAACRGTDGQPMDDALKHDLAAATARPQQVVVSAIEGGEAVAKKAPQRAPLPAKAPRFATSTAPAAKQQPLPTPTPAPAPHTPAPAPRVEERNVPPLPAAPSRQGPDAASQKEAEIFRRMPWIRP